MELEQIQDKLKILIKASILTIVVLISYSAGYTINAALSLPNSYISGMWCAITAVVVFDDLPARVRILMKDRLLGTLVGVLAASLSIILLSKPLWSVVISLFIVVSFVVYFRWHGALKIACVTVLVVGTTSQGLSDRDIWILSSMRFVEAVIGGIISLLATIVIYKIRKMRLW